MQDDPYSPVTPGAPSIEVVFGARIREQRMALGLSQAALATRARDQDVDGEGGATIKLDDTAIARVERGARSVSLVQAVALASALEVSVESLLSASPAMDAEQELEVAIRQADEMRSHARVASTKAGLAEERVERLREIVNQNRSTGGREQ